MFRVAYLFVAIGCGRLNFDAQVSGDAQGAPEPGDSVEPTVDQIGCADRAREAFTDLGVYPSIAGCEATWTNTVDMRAAPTGLACGGTTNCLTAADACAPSWHVCGTAGDPAELSSRVSSSECLSAGGALAGGYLSAMSHCSSLTATCNYVQPIGCAAAAGACAQVVCCGPLCSNGNFCADAVWPAQTRVSPQQNACSSMTSAGSSGVLCCR
jgi:hypothetical protein